MNATDDFSSNYIERVRLILEDADAILVGAGAGLSAAAGLLYFDPDTFRTMFPGYHERYGIGYIYEAAFHPFKTPEEFFGYWARHILAIRHRYPAGQPYLDLFKLLGHHNYFMLTTNVDGQFAKAGFDPQRICTPQGDYAFFQCQRPCTDDLYPNLSFVEGMVSAMAADEFAIPGYLLPHCPKCGALLEPNIHKGPNFVSKPWTQKYEELHHFLRECSTGKFVLLEFGVGFNTAGIIRYPFERILRVNSNATLIRVNLENPSIEGFVSENERAVSVAADAGQFIAKLKEQEVSS